MNSSRYHLCQPPGSLRRPGVRSDNLLLGPASLLPFKGEWQAMANSLPQGDVLILLPPTNTPSRNILDRVTMLLQARGHHVTTILTDRLT